MHNLALPDLEPRRWLLHPPGISFPSPVEKPRDLGLATSPLDARSFATLEEALAATLHHAATGEAS